MDSDHRGDGQSSLDTTQQSPRNYSFLIRMSRRMGNIATQSSFINDVKSFMNYEIGYGSATKWWEAGVTKIKGEKSQEEQSQRPQPNKKSGEKEVPAKKEKELKKIVSQSHEVLMAANTVFPITLFPDTVTVDRTKVTITRRDFFWSSDVMSIRIEDVLNVSATVGPLFGSLTVASRVMSTIDHFKINHFWRNDAIRLKHIIQGYVIAQHNNIDTAHLNKKDLVETLIELGHDSNN